MGETASRVGLANSLCRKFTPHTEVPLATQIPANAHPLLPAREALAEFWSDRQALGK